MKKEIIVFLGLFLIISFLMHSDKWLSHPLEHIVNLQNAAAYGVGVFHPLLFMIPIYIILWIPRSIFRIIIKTLKKG